ncbi:hypothetical protein PMAYCL1PPCAC_04308, partial [Pristionchus mayeri]
PVATLLQSEKLVTSPGRSQQQQPPQVLLQLPDSRMSSNEELGVLPAALAALPVVQRRQSVFYDLLTVFKKPSHQQESPVRGARVPLPKRGFIAHSTSGQQLQQTQQREGEAFLGPKEELGEDGKPLTKHDILNKIRQKKEVIETLRTQPWTMNRKRRMLHIAQKYLQQQESKVPKSHLYLEEFNKRMAVVRRYLFNFRTYLIPWEGKIKRIESHFGSVVSSYFTFLRWIVFVNLVISLLVIAFVVLPESIADMADHNRTRTSSAMKNIPENQTRHADRFGIVIQFDGHLKYSPIFYGFYSNVEYLSEKVKYALPLAYFLVTISVFSISFFAILRKMAQNARLSKLSGSKAEQYIFNWKVFTGWDFTIGNNDTASNTVMAIVIKLRESIAEKRAAGDHHIKWSKRFLRLLANLMVISMLLFSIFAISSAVEGIGGTSNGLEKVDKAMFKKAEIPTVISTITHVFPMIFDLIGRMEGYHPRTSLRVHLARVLILYLLNYFTLMLSLYDKIKESANKNETMNSTATPPRSKRFLISEDPYLNRNFASPQQFLDLLQQGNDRWAENETDSPAAITRASRLKREATTVTPSPFTMQPQFGPINVNNPNAYLRNTTGTEKEGFTSLHVGSPQMPIFTPPPKLHPPWRPGNTATQVGGPDGRVTPRPTKRPPKQGETRRTARPTTTTTKASTTTTTTSLSSSPSMSSRTSSTPTLEYPTSSEEVEVPEAATTSSINVVGKPQPTAQARTSGGTPLNLDCWETVIGQEIVKLVTMDLVFTIASILVIDFLRGLWIKYCSSWWCWDIETTFPEYGEFKVAENVLHIINNQGLIWLGFFFAPLLPFINNIKLIIIMYIRGWACMTCNVPAREIFRASRSSNFFLMILLMWMMMCATTVGIALSSFTPSDKCGPFAGSEKFYTVLSTKLSYILGEKITAKFEIFATPGIIVPLLILLLLVIYFLFSLVRALREANTDLKKQLVHERTEEKKKIFELAGGAKAKKETEARDREKQKSWMRKHLSKIEAKRRQPWRQYNGKEYDPSLKASDSSSSSSSSSESESETEELIEFPPASSTAETIAVPIRDIQSPETPLDRPMSVSSNGQIGVRPKRELVHSTSSQFHRRLSRVGQQSSPSVNSLVDVQSAVVEVATPEEIRLVPSSSKHDIKVHHKPALQSTKEEDSARFSADESTRERKKKEKEEKREKKEKKAAKKLEKEAACPDFQPWPSIDEAKEAQKQKKMRNPFAFFRPQTLPTTPIGSAAQPSTSQSSGDKQGTSSSFSDAPPPPPPHGLPDSRRSSASPTRRFRISVSPTRNLRADEEMNTLQRRFVITQESLPSSSANLSPRAPIASFGDDDSPRVVEKPI